MDGWRTRADPESLDTGLDNLSGIQRPRESSEDNPRPTSTPRLAEFQVLMAAVFNNLLFDPMAHYTRSVKKVTDQAGQLGHEIQVFLTGTARRSKEIVLKYLSTAQYKLYEAAMGKEWSKWMDFDAVAVIPPDQIRKYLEENNVSEDKIVGTRWVHTDKNDGKLSVSGKKLEIDAKSRLVVQGHQELIDHTMRTDAPAGSLLGFNIVASTAALKKWPVAKADATNAYLQSKGILRMLLLKLPNPPPPDVEPGSLLRAKGSIYGTKDAARAWWMFLKDTVVSLGWTLSLFEKALFLLFDQGELVGLILSHVDDLFTAGTGPLYEKSMKKLRDEVKLTFEEPPFRYCGKIVKQDEDFTIRVNQLEVAENLEMPYIDKDRRKDPNADLTPDEVSELRSSLGSLGWLARQTRPDIAVEVSLGAQSMSGPKIKNLIDAGVTVQQAKREKHRELVFHASHKLDFATMQVFGCVDSSLCNVDDPKLGEKTKSQCGYIAGVITPNVLDDEIADCHILEWTTGTIKRVCRSSLGAEANGMTEGIEGLAWIQATGMDTGHLHRAPHATA